MFYFGIIKPNKVTAGWFNDMWSYRKAITFNNSGSAVTNQKVKLDIDTAALYTAGKIKISCDDSRFTDINGDPLQYFLDSANGACNTSSTDYYVLIPTIYAGSTTIYHYYGNPSATKGSQLSQFSQTTFSQSSTTTNSEEKGKGPIAYWNMDEGQGTTLNDSGQARMTGTLGSGTSAPAWQTEDMCIAGKCLKFDGNDFVSIGSTVRDVQTISFWVKPTTTSQNFIDLDNGTHYISDTSGVVSATGFSSPTIYVNGKSNGTLTANQWNHIEVTTATSFNATSIKLGRRTTNYLTGFMDEVKLFNYARSVAEIKADFNARGTLKGEALRTQGLPLQNPGGAFMSEGLVGYWKMDEASWNGTTNEVIDSSGNANHGVGVGSTKPTTGAGKFGNGGVFNSSIPQNQYISIGTTVSSIQTIAFWVKPSSNDTSLLALNGTNYISASSGTISSTGFTSPTIYVNGVPGSTLSSNVWQMVTVTTATDISGSAIKFGLFGSAYFSGQIDDVKDVQLPANSGTG